MDDERPPSLLGTTLQRSFATGRFFLGYGIVVSLVLGVSLSFGPPSAFTSAFPILLPIFGIVGSMGALVVFTNDRVKGVLEYLLAYGVTPRQIFLNILYASFVLVSIVLAAALAGSVGVFVARGHAPSPAFALLLGVYSLPMSYVSVAFSATTGMFWTSLSSPRSGMNSPIGLAPLIGIFPSAATLGLLVVLGEAGLVSATSLLLVALGMVGVFASIVIVLLGTMNRFLREERLLSPA